MSPGSYSLTAGAYFTFDKANLMERELLEHHPELLPLRYLTSTTPMDKFPEEIRDNVRLLATVRCYLHSPR
jgi:hypothetical protein